MNRRSGFTLLELLIASAILIIILAALGALFASSSQAYRSNVRVTERQQEAETAIQLLIHEIGLAGYRGVGQHDADRAFSGDGRTLVITHGVSGAPDTVQVRYFEDRFLPGERLVTFGINAESRTIFRREGTGEPQDIAANVVDLQVIQYIRRDGIRVEVPREGPIPPVPGNLAALNLEITFVDGSLWRFPIGLNNPQTTGGG
ncbi:MAG: prepilin-type N-terminal cleavage/methylation domain-containing protein [Truepera sp.]|nr:prepilin-type N-terminal cleavage/methylation domain-containing protein [Truepera sp.]